MIKKGCLFFLGLFLGAGWLFAEEIPVRTHFTIAVPDFESQISLGIYDAKGRLVRRLAEMRPEKDFEVGLNGLIAYWDGKNDRGREVSAGNYSVLGFAVGELSVEHLASVGNDWMEGEGDKLPVAEILDITMGPGASLICLCKLQTGEDAVFAYDPALDVLQWLHVLSTKKSEQKGNGSWILGHPATQCLVVAQGANVEMLDATRGVLLAQGTLPNAPLGMNIHHDRMQVVTENGVQSFDLMGFLPIAESLKCPEGLMSYAQAGKWQVGIDMEQRAWVGAGSEWQVLLPEVAQFTAVNLGKKGDFWALVKEGKEEQWKVGQFHSDGTFLRKIESETFQGTPITIAASPEGTLLYVLSKISPAGSELLGLRQGREKAEGSWEIFFRKEIAPDKLLAPKGYQKLPVRMKLEVASAVGKGRESTILQISNASEDGIRLMTVDGLLLANMMPMSSISGAFVAMDPEQSSALRFWLYTGGIAEEYRVQGLEQIARLEIGQITWPPETE